MQQKFVESFLLWAHRFTPLPRATIPFGGGGQGGRPKRRSKRNEDQIRKTDHVEQSENPIFLRFPHVSINIFVQESCVRRKQKSNPLRVLGGDENYLEQWL